MVNIIRYKGLRITLFLLIIITIVLCHVSINQVVADGTKDGPFEISEGDLINIQCGTSYTLTWQFQVETNERAIYWEIFGYMVIKSGWGPNASCTTPVLNETGTNYEYVCHGYYAKYRVESTTIVTCTRQDQTNGGGNDGGFDPMIILYIGIPIIIIFGIALIIVLSLRSKKKQDFF